jgi:hypothetical protein
MSNGKPRLTKCQDLKPELAFRSFAETVIPSRMHGRQVQTLSAREI